MIERAKAGSNEKCFFELFRERVRGVSLAGKRRFVGDNVEISVDESFIHNGLSYLIEIDSGNMAKVLVGQYVLINALHTSSREQLFFLVIHTYQDYNPQRTIKNLELINNKLFRGAGIGFGAIHIDALKRWGGGEVSKFIGLFASA